MLGNSEWQVPSGTLEVKFQPARLSQILLQNSDLLYTGGCLSIYISDMA